MHTRIHTQHLCHIIFADCVVSQYLFIFISHFVWMQAAIPATATTTTITSTVTLSITRLILRKRYADAWISPPSTTTCNLITKVGRLSLQGEYCHCYIVRIFRISLNGCGLRVTYVPKPPNLPPSPLVRILSCLNFMRRHYQSKHDSASRMFIEAMSSSPVGPTEGHPLPDTFRLHCRSVKIYG